MFNLARTWTCSLSLQSDLALLQRKLNLVDIYWDASHPDFNAQTFSYIFKGL